MVVTQAAIKAEMALVMGTRETDAAPIPDANTAISIEACRQRHGRPALKQPSFNWNAPDKFIELLISKWKLYTYFKLRHMS